MKVSHGKVERRTPEQWTRRIKEVDRTLDIVWSRSLSRWCIVQYPENEEAPNNATQGDDKRFNTHITLLVYQDENGDYLELGEGIITMIKSMDRARNGDLNDMKQQIRDAQDARIAEENAKYDEIREEARKHFGARAADRIHYVIDKEKSYASKTRRRID